MKPEGMYYIEDPLLETPENVNQPPQAWKDTQVVGKPLPRIDAYERVSGAAEYTSDVTLPDMLYGAILHCPHAHAQVKKVDTSKAEKMPGVRAVISDATPGANLPWYASRAGALSRLFDPHCRFHGEEVAAVAAETPYQAWDAVRAIQVEYELLPFVSSEEDALKPGAPAIHEGGNRVGDVQVYERGKVAAGFAEADVVLEQTYTTACEIQAPTETHCCVAKWDGDQLTVWESTQGVYSVQSTLAQLLKLPISHVRVIGRYMGGGFGNKLSTGKYSIIAALMARACGRPVKLQLPREQSFLSVGNRPGNRMTLKAGVKKDGTLTALQMTVTGSGGAYPGGGTGSVDWLVRDLYGCPNVHTEATDVYINAGQARPMRAPGHPQGAWALEQMMDALAEAIKLDPVALRLKNISTVSQARQGEPPYTSTGLAACLSEGAKAFGWDAARTREAAAGPIRRGVGMAACLWSGGSGGPPSTVIVKLFADGSLNLNMGASDLGTGTKTVMAMVVAEELGISMDKIHAENADTGTTQYATGSGGSKTVPTEAPATRAAALDLKQQLIEMAAAQLKVPPEELVLRGGEALSTADPSKKVALNAITALRRRGVLVGIGYRGPNPEGKAICPFAAHFAEVEVNTRTGEIKVVRLLAAHDSGRVMNQRTYQNQVFGGMIMGLGLALTEGRVLDRHHTGRMLNLNWHDYKIPTALDVPADPACLPIDPRDSECNITGAKGIGEPATIPTAPAIANAVYNAIGLRVTDTPMNPARICELLAARARRA